MFSYEKSNVIKLINLLDKLLLSFILEILSLSFILFFCLLCLSGNIWCVSDILIENQKQLIETRIKEKRFFSLLAV